MTQNYMHEGDNFDESTGGRGSKLLSFILILYLFASGFTFVLGGETDAGSLVGRAAVPEIVLMIFLFISLIVIKGFSVPKLGLVSLGMLGVFCLSTAIAAFTTGLGTRPNVVIFEILVHAFGIIGFIGIYRYCRSLSIERRAELLMWWARTAGVLAFIGVWDFFSSYVGLPRFIGNILPARPSEMGVDGKLPSGVVGTFRNYGQAGAFYHMTLTCAIATFATRKGMTRQRSESLFWCLLLGVATMLTLKRAAILGLVVGLVALLIRERWFRSPWLVFLLAVLGGVFFYAFSTLLNMEGGESFAWNLSYKFGDDGVDRLHEFAGENIGAVMQSLSTNPLTGAGVLGTMIDRTWEVHSTYLKVLGDFGVLGVIAYVIFLVSFVRTCLIPHNDSHEAKSFARYFAPLFLGLLVSWGYTYHLRKREFWISTALIAGLMAPVCFRDDSASSTETSR